MALTIGQIAAVSYAAVLNASRKAENQWAESALFREAERQGMVVRKSFGSSLDVSLDYQRNPSATFLVTDLAGTSMTKTEVMTAASFSPAEISIDVTWSKRDEVQ